MVKPKFTVYWSRDAEENLKEIFNYIRQHSPKNALKIVTGIINLSKSLAYSPLQFQECVELPTKNKIYRKASYPPFKIIYRIKNQRIEVLSIFHSSRNPKKLSALKKIKA
jgi:plasmid stabilization system protein ParE